MLIASLPSRLTASLSNAEDCTGLPCTLASNHFAADVESALMNCGRVSSTYPA